MKYIDMHCDTISRLLLPEVAERGETLAENQGHLDLARMREGECLAQCFALYTNLEREKDPYGYCKKLLALFKEEMEKNREIISQATDTGQILENERQGRMSALLTIEEGEVCRGDLDVLREFYDCGVRMMTLTWNFENSLAWPNRIDWKTGKTRPETERGLKEKGVAFVEEMERLGMIIDVSHLGDAGFFQVLNTTKKPFVASHSNARALASHVRNLTDEMIRALADRGGVMGINFAPAFLSDTQEKRGREGQSLVTDMVAHMKYIKNVGGIGCLGLGSDFDGISGQLEADSPAAFGKIADEMKRQGFTASEIEAVFYGNTLRVFDETLR